MFGLNTRKIGNNAEEQASQYLKKLGYKILTKNYTIRGGEIDIIARDKDVLVFVEVKMRSNSNFGRSIESITSWKQKALQKAALFYIQKISWGNKSYRFDLVTIDHNPSGEDTISLISNILEG